MKKITIYIIIAVVSVGVLSVLLLLYSKGKNNQNNSEITDIQINFGSNQNESTITKDISLPEYSKTNREISWKSSNETYINSKGIVNRPIGKDVKVNLTATIKMRNINYYKRFSLLVLKRDTNESIFESSIEDLTKYNNGIVPEISLDEEGKITFIDGKFTDYIIKSPVDVLYSLNSIKSLMGISSPENEFAVVNQNISDDLVYYKLQQVFNGVEVYGKELVVCVDKDGNSVSVSGHYLPISNLNTNPSIQEGKIINLFETLDRRRIESVELVVYPRKDKTVQLAWKVHILNNKLIGPSSNRLEFYDAENAQKLGEISLVKG